MKRDPKKPFDSKEVGKHQEVNKVNLTLPPKFDESKQEQQEIEGEEKECREEKGADELKQKEIEYDLKHESESCSKELDLKGVIAVNKT